MTRPRMRQLYVSLVLTGAVFCATNISASGRTVRSLDDDWRFHLGDVTNAQAVDFDDSTWRRLDVPHDWSIEGEFNEHHPTGKQGGFLPAGIGWYRKHFALPESMSGKRVAVEFDGVMANSEVWINGHRLGGRPNAYVSFRYELTDRVRFGDGEPNLLAVRVDNSRQPASRWYTGAGIYRHVRLTVTDPLHVVPNGVFVTTPDVSADRATVRIQTEVVNQSDVPHAFQLQTNLVDPAGKIVDTTESLEALPPGETGNFEQQLVVATPRRWSLSDPTLYRLVTRIVDGDRTVDEVSTSFGIRQIEFRSDTGFWLNGGNVKIKGVCLHHDAGALGAAVPLAAWEMRLALLQELGVNAVRTAHNPPAPEFLDLCDRMGILVMLEFFDCWTKGKTKYDYHLHFDQWATTDARDTIRRDRNRPSVILYSVGNEIRDTRDTPLAKRVLAELIEVCHETDPTRPVTQALFRPNTSGDYENGLADMLDVVGTNYRDPELLSAWRAKPSRKIIGTEQGHERRIWLAARDNPQHAGQFLWVGIDYLGESPGWPVTSFNAGLLDRTGHPYPRAFERKSWWSDRPMVAIFRRIAPTEETPVDPGYELIEWKRRQVLFPDWTPKELAPHREQVEVYSNCEEVELTLNGKSLGSKKLPTDGRPRQWDVEFETGVLAAVGRDSNGTVISDGLRTAEEAARIRLRVADLPLMTNWDSLAFVEVEVVDKHGTRVPRASNLIKFRVTGPGRIVAVDNGSITSHEPFVATQRHAHDGRALVIVRATAAGTIEITADADGIATGSIRLDASSFATQR
jgi:beta-galactosidase